MATILVHMAERPWTEQALHLACAMARNRGAYVVLLRLMKPQHYSWLGTPFGGSVISEEESDVLWNYKTIAEKYGVDLRIQQMQYYELVGALVEAADLVSAETVFAHVPPSAFPFWQRYQTSSLRRQLAREKHALCTLDDPVQAVTPQQRAAEARS